METFHNVHFLRLIPFALMRLNQFSVINHDSLNANCDGNGVHVDQFNFIMTNHRLVVWIQKSGLEISVVSHPIEVSQCQRSNEGSFMIPRWRSTLSTSKPQVKHFSKVTELTKSPQSHHSLALVYRLLHSINRHISIFNHLNLT
jgi:hypothetical protein